MQGGEAREIADRDGMDPFARGICTSENHRRDDYIASAVIRQILRDTYNLC